MAYNIPSKPKTGGGNLSYLLPRPVAPSGVSGGYGGYQPPTTGQVSQYRQQMQQYNAKTGLMDEVYAATERTNAANKKREDEIRSMMDEVIGMYRQGGAFGQGVEAQLGRERTQTLATGGQSLISSGMYNTTGLAGLSTQFAENVAMPTRMKLEDLRMEKLQGALGQKASFVESITDQSPDYRLLAELMAK